MELERKSGKFLPSCVNTVNEALDNHPTITVSGALFSRYQTKKNRRAAGRFRVDDAYLLVYAAIIPSKVDFRLVFCELMLPTRLSMAENCFV